MSDDFTLSGAGLETELPQFLAHLASSQPSLAAVFSEHVEILREASSDEVRRSARAQFNAAVKDSLLSGTVANQEAGS